MLNILYSENMHISSLRLHGRQSSLFQGDRIWILFLELHIQSEDLCKDFSPRKLTFKDRTGLLDVCCSGYKYSITCSNSVLKCVKELASQQLQLKIWKKKV